MTGFWVLKLPAGRLDHDRIAAHGEKPKEWKQGEKGGRRENNVNTCTLRYYSIVEGLTSGKV